MEDKKTESTRKHRRGKLKSELRLGSSFRASVVADYLSGDSGQRVVAARHFTIEP